MSPTAEEPALSEIYQKINQLGLQTQRGALTPEKLASALEGLKQETRAERLRLTEKLEKALTPGLQGEPFGIPQSPSRPLDKEDLEKLEEKLKGFFEGPMPEPLAKDLFLLKELEESERFLDRAWRFTLRPGKGGSKEALLALEQERSGFGGSKPDSKASPSPGASDQGPGKAQDRSDEPGLDPFQVGGGKSQKEGRAVAGSEKGQGEKGPPFDLQAGRGPTFQEKGRPDSTALSSSMEIRTGTRWGWEKEDRPGLVEEIPLSFRKGREAALNRERIPEDYKTYVKNYFLSLQEGKGGRHDLRHRPTGGSSP